MFTQTICQMKLVSPSHAVGQTVSFSSIHQQWSLFVAGRGVAGRRGGPVLTGLQQRLMLSPRLPQTQLQLPKDQLRWFHEDDLRLGRAVHLGKEILSQHSDWGHPIQECA